MKTKNILLALLALILVGCNTTSKKLETNKDLADKVFTNGKIYTVNEAQPWAEAVAIKDKKIVFVGTSKEAKAYIGDNTKTTDLKGKMMLPGFIEGHIHPVTGALATVGVDLQYDSVEEVLKAVKEYADANPDLEVIRGFGWRYTLFPSTGPTRDLLDEIVSDKPVVLFAIDAHSAWANSMALEMANINQETPDPQPGYSHYQRDPKTKEATGYLVEVPAMLEVLNEIQPQNVETIAKELGNLMPQFPAAGITSLFDAGIIGIPEEAGFDMYLNLEKQGKLPLRVVGCTYHNKPDIDPLPIIRSLRDKYNTELVQAKVLKINIDGGDAQHTGCFLQPYADKPETSGNPIFTQEQLNKLVIAADAEGIDCHFHSFGDGAVRMTLDAIEAATNANPKRDRRHTIGHAIYMHEDDIPRFAELNAIAQMSIQWAMPDATNLKISVERLGEEIVSTRHHRARSVIEANGKVAFGTDWPAAGHYSTYKPLEAIEVAVTREMIKDFKGVREIMPPINERLTLEQAIKSSTLSPAYQIHFDDKVGSIEVGKLADLVILEKNLFDIEPKEISSVKVIGTLMNGQFTFNENLE